MCVEIGPWLLWFFLVPLSVGICKKDDYAFSAILPASANLLPQWHNVWGTAQIQNEINVWDVDARTECGCSHYAGIWVLDWLSMDAVFAFLICLSVEHLHQPTLTVGRWSWYVRCPISRFNQPYIWAMGSVWLENAVWNMLSVFVCKIKCL